MSTRELEDRACAYCDMTRADCEDAANHGYIKCCPDCDHWTDAGIARSRLPADTDTGRGQ